MIDPTKVLIAEDDFTSRTMLSALLRKLGYSVTATSNGQEAWTAISQPDAPKLAILDWMMPGLDGVEICRRLRLMQSDCPPYLILLTARTDKQDIVKGLEAGANDYLVKPYDVGELAARVAVGRRVTEIQAQLAHTIDELREAMGQLRTLRGIVPICMHCKSVRDDHGYWKLVEAYVSQHSDAQFSHSICPKCMEKYYSELEEACPTMDPPEAQGDVSIA